jgi:hypothetical protein
VLPHSNILLVSSPVVATRLGMKNFVPDYKDYLDAQLLQVTGVRAGLMFGCPSYYTPGGLAVCHYHDNLFLRLPADQAQELIERDPQASGEGPMGPKRSMGKNWVFLHVPDLAALRKRLPLILESISFTASLPPKAKKKS